MNRWLLIGSLAGMMFAFSGCSSTGSKSGCSGGGGGIFGSSAACGPGCSNGKCGGVGGGRLAGKFAGGNGHGGGCNGNCGGNCGGGLKGLGSRAAGLLGANPCGGGRTGCRAGAIGWQQGGLDYSSHLQPGLMGHNAAQNLNARPFTPGPPTGQVAYPYYTVRGPRDFLVDNPPTIGR